MTLERGVFQFFGILIQLSAEFDFFDAKFGIYVKNYTLGFSFSWLGLEFT